MGRRVRGTAEENIGLLMRVEAAAQEEVVVGLVMINKALAEEEI